MKPEDKEKLIESYNRSFSKYGYDHRALQWFRGPGGRQPLRYRILSEIGTLESCSILDVGCGFGDLGGFLANRGVKVRYTGYDINPNLINKAKMVHPDLHCEVKDIESDKIDAQFDCVFESGVFNNKISDNRRWVKSMLVKMFELCKKGVAANFQSTYVDFTQDEAYRARPEEIFSFCKTLSKRVLLRHDYMPFEFTIYLYKDDRISANNVFVEVEEKFVTAG